MSVRDSSPANSHPLTGSVEWRGLTVLEAPAHPYRGVVPSILLHGLAVVALLSLRMALPEVDRGSKHFTLTAAVPPRQAAARRSEPAVPQRQPIVSVVPPLEWHISQPRTAVRLAPRVESPRVAPIALPAPVPLLVPAPPAETPPLPVAFQMPRPVVRTGTFGSARAAAAVNPPPALPREPGAFETVATANPTSSKASVKTGAFEVSGEPREVSLAVPKVASTGFEGVQARRAWQVAGAARGDAGFGAVAAARTTEIQPPVHEGSFASTVVPPALPKARMEAKRSSDVEILFKPLPVYTEEARRLKIEGEVLVEVLFAASGEVRISRVVQSLGHGLDEAAVRAAERIRFKPAENNGNPVDSVAIARITFRLAY